ncbi:hypothetical protein B9T18_09470 [Wohlfahrtiimonas chitiniclastica]|nr:hypothetical protein B9T18_09470 [Wohlfahrtiimonas chitiniclastica]
MSQRGITQDMIDFTLNFGEITNDKWFTNKKTLQKSIKQLEQQIKMAKRLLDKGGIVVVAADETLLTAYDFDSAKYNY